LPRQPARRGTGLRAPPPRRVTRRTGDTPAPTHAAHIRARSDRPRAARVTSAATTAGADPVIPRREAPGAPPAKRRPAKKKQKRKQKKKRSKQAKKATKRAKKASRRAAHPLRTSGADTVHDLSRMGIRLRAVGEAPAIGWTITRAATVAACSIRSSRVTPARSVQRWVSPSTGVSDQLPCAWLPRRDYPLCLGPARWCVPKRPKEPSHYRDQPGRGFALGDVRSRMWCKMVG
jgi:hypothetical protein